MSTNYDSHVKRGRKKREGEAQCLVCGGRSVGVNFGVHTCSPCKAFFRRNAVKLGVCLLIETIYLLFFVFISLDI
jgi:ribosomal protein L37AE/L43A